MRSHIKLGQIGGIEIGLHYSWFVIALLITFSLATHFRSVNPAWNIAWVWAAAVITSILFFATLLLHELAHSLLAISRGLRVQLPDGGREVAAPIRDQIFAVEFSPVPAWPVPPQAAFR